MASEILIIFLSIILLASGAVTGIPTNTANEIFTLDYNETIISSMTAYADEDEEDDEDESSGTGKLINKLEKTIAKIEDLGSVVDEAVIIDTTTQSLNQLRSDVSELDISTKLKKELLPEIDNAIKKLEQAAVQILKGKEKQTNKKIEQSQQIMENILKTINSKKGAELTPTDKASLIEDVQTIITNSQLRDENVLGIVDENTQLVLTGEILQLIDEKIGAVPSIVSELESKGVTVEIELVEQSPLVITIRLSAAADRIIDVAPIVCGETITLGLLQFYESLDDPSLRDLGVLDGLVLFFLNGGLCEEAPQKAFMQPEILPQVRNLLFEVGKFLIHNGTPDDIVDALNQPAIRDIWLDAANKLDIIHGGHARALLDLFVRLIGSIISGIKFNDLNGNGVFDLSEVGIEGWEIFLIDDVSASVIETTTTNTTGGYSFTSLAMGQYIVAEETREGFVQTFPDPIGPSGGVHLINIEKARESVTDINFGNNALPTEITIEIVSTDPENGYLGILGPSCSTSPTARTVTEDRIFIGPRQYNPSISAAGCYRAWATWDVSSIPDTATVLDVEMKFEKLPKSHPLHDGNVQALIYSLENKPDLVSDAVLRADIRDGTLYVNGDPNFSVNGNHTTNLSSLAKDGLTNKLNAGTNWFGIGISASNESTSNWNLAEIRNVILVVKYSP